MWTKQLDFVVQSTGSFLVFLLLFFFWFFFRHHNLYRHIGVQRNTELAAILSQKLGKLVTTVSPLKKAYEKNGNKQERAEMRITRERKNRNKEKGAKGMRITRLKGKQKQATKRWKCESQKTSKTDTRKKEDEMVITRISEKFEEEDN